MPDPTEVKTSKINNFLSKIFSCFKRNNIADSSGAADNSVQILNNINSFSEKTVDDILVPRSDIIAVGDNISAEDLAKTIIASNHTRTLVYHDNLDSVVGFIHIKDLFELVVKKKKFNIKKLLRKHIVATHAMKLVDLLASMQAQRVHIAIVVDEYGGTDGLVTIEDIIEEIVGEIDDEHDEDSSAELYKILRPGLITAKARALISDIEKIIGCDLIKNDEEIDTIGGLVLAKHGSIPKKGSFIKLEDNIEIEIIEATNRSIKRMKITYNPTNTKHT